MKVQILDCTLRDGGYYNSWDFDSGLIEDYLIAMAAISVDYVELGFRSLNTDGFKGGCAYTSDRFIRDLCVPGDLKLGVMVNASEIVRHKEGPEAALSKLFESAVESPLTLVRIACHIHEFEGALPGCAWLKEKGYEVGINLMQIADRSKEEIEKISQIAAKYPIDVLYFADSMGGMSPDQTSEVISNLRFKWDGPLGIHTHDNMGSALANSMRAVKDGVSWVDGTVTGMGRGPGNVKTEYLAIELEEYRENSLNIMPLLSVIDKYFKPLQDKYGWGTNTYYYLAGKYGIHPSFVQEMLSDSRYDDVDLIAILEHLREAGGKKFSVQTLESGRNFFKGTPSGAWAPSSLIKGREVLVIGAGPGAEKYCAAIEDYISSSDPVVIALNTQSTIKEDLIDLRAASHPVRLLADCPTHLNLPQPLATPASMLPEFLRDSLAKKSLLDFGLSVETDTFLCNETHCVLPTSLVIAYALAIAASGKATRVLLAGFDGYSADDPRMAEMDKLLNRYQSEKGVPPLLAITPSRYSVPQTSLYSMI
jgi:4-hydroxy 2-oxovalerate aldolase